MVKKILIGFVALIVLVAVFSAGSDDTGNNSETSNGGESQAETSNEEVAVASIGDPVRDGNFEFVVAGIECGLETVGDEFLNETAQGQFCLLDVTVENIGSEAQMLSASDQYLYDSQERKFTADSTATLYHNDDSTSFFLEDINPGNSVSGQILFDVPEGAEIVKAELHDSAFSGGVEVSLQ